MSGGVGAGEEDAVGLVADDDGAGSAAEAGHGGVVGVGGRRGVGDEDARLHGGEVEDADAVGRVVDHLFVVGRVGVDVEVEGAGVGLVGDAPDAVAGVFVDPGLGRELFGGCAGLSMERWSERKAARARAVRDASGRRAIRGTPEFETMRRAVKRPSFVGRPGLCCWAGRLG